MPYEHYKDALIEVAASGAAPQGELRAHLDECISCRAALDEERSLFSAVDSGLHASANAEVPASFLPRVRAQLDEVVLAHHRWNSGWFALAGVTLAASLLFAIRIRQNHIVTSALHANATRPKVERLIPTGQAPLTSAPSAETGVSVPGRRVFAGSFEYQRKLVSANATPKVLIPKDQEILLAEYARQLSSRKRPPLVAGDVVQAAVTPLEVAPIQIPELDVKPLTEEGSK